MLKARLLTAIVLLAVFVPVTLFAPIGLFRALIGIVLVFAAWEWARLLKFKDYVPVFYAVLAALAMLASLTTATQGGEPVGLYKAAGLFWLLVVPYAFVRRPVLAAGAWRVFMLVAGIVLLLASGHALVDARMRGVGFVLSLLLVVWVADIGAYFTGRQFGRRKLAVTISPGKSWEGAIGGAILVLVLAAVGIATQFAAPTLFTAYAARFGVPRAMVCVLVLVVFSVLGDLFESLLKRQAGVKDSSALLPGHGGVLDRVDALLPVLPIAMWFLS
ncbi:phosphatidate cytidylyltransferase [Robbsia sp. Bb-Pol-6]|uniref:Phosphatidate cytidylyltransferase n=1 Tax=Robbsia betulipollinis TaxID=2981849 RepID=A0ABT3ZJ11_9BURK|nr:phosphatidate cytidylyltransferase [Robbsia betulipollinis]MCY0386310.1 phosphatidate cytidylyltransferase [Robbsia betulipollinis]